MNTPAPWAARNPALVESLPGNEVAALAFLAAYLGWGRSTIETILTEEADVQVWRDLLHAGRTLASICEPMVNQHERREAQKRHEHINPKLL